MRFETKVLCDKWEDCRIDWECDIAQTKDGFELLPNVKSVFYTDPDSDEEKEWKGDINNILFYVDINRSIQPSYITVEEDSIDIDWGV